MMTDEIISIRLEWPVICKLACMAMWMGITFDQLVEVAVKEKLEALKVPHG